MATQVAGNAFVDQIFKEIIWPTRDEIMDNRYFTDLRNGKLTQRRMQGFSLEHTFFNWTLLKGTAIRMLKADTLNSFKGNLYQISEERTHPDLCTKFGLAVGLTEADFENHVPTHETLMHTSVNVASPLTINNPAAGRSSGMFNETIVQRYSEEFATYLPKAPYNLSEDAIEFFTIHGIVDKEHSAMAAEAVAKIAMTDRDQELVWYTVQLQAKLKKAKFEGMYDAYA
jgi:pyrroloquinoline quinone (PQQ) biosynthesis protein C